MNFDFLVLRSIILCQVLFGSATALWAQNEEVTFKTSSILNRKYVVANDWGGLSLDRHGEDYNSSKYGSKHDFPPSPIGQDVQEVRPTIALEYMEIEVFLLNGGRDSWSLKEVELEVLEEFDYSRTTCTVGEWELFTPKFIGYKPTFSIAKIQPELKDRPENITLWSKPKKSGLQFVIKVVAAGSMDQVVYSYRFKLTMESVSSTGLTITIFSDKSYFIASP